MPTETKTPEKDYSPSSEIQPKIVEYRDAATLRLDAPGTVFDPTQEDKYFQDPFETGGVLCVEGIADGNVTRVFIDQDTAVKVTFDQHGNRIGKIQGVDRNSDTAASMTPFVIGEEWKGSLAGTEGMRVTSVMAPYKHLYLVEPTPENSPFSDGEKYLEGWRANQTRIRASQARTAIVAWNTSSIEKEKNEFSVHSFSEAERAKAPRLSDAFIDKLRGNIAKDPRHEGRFAADSIEVMRIASYNADNMAFWDDPDAAKKFHKEMFTLESEWGKEVPDPKAEKGVRTNILPHVAFTQFDSDAFVEKRVRNETAETNNRIYLNPRFQDAARVFAEIIKEANNQNLAFRSKIYNYDDMHQGLQRKRVKSGEQEYEKYKGLKSRNDGILLYATDVDRDKVLKIVEEVYRRNPDAFRARETNPVAFKVADGVAVGTEPQPQLDEDKVSLLQDRSKLVNDVLMDHYNRGITHGHYDQFRQDLSRHLAANGVNPDNWAFDKK